MVLVTSRGVRTQICLKKYHLLGLDEFIWSYSGCHHNPDHVSRVLLRVSAGSGFWKAFSTFRLSVTDLKRPGRYFLISVTELYIKREGCILNNAVYNFFTIMSPHSYFYGHNRNGCSIQLQETSFNKWNVDEIHVPVSKSQYYNNNYC